MPANISYCRNATLDNSGRAMREGMVRQLVEKGAEVAAKDGVVTLKGKVTGLYEKQMANSLAKGVAGVKDVDDQMDYEKVSPVVGGNAGGATPSQQEPSPTKPSKPVAQKPAAHGPSAGDKARSDMLVNAVGCQSRDEACRHQAAYSAEVRKAWLRG